jgi:hypothetical protein
MQGLKTLAHFQFMQAIIGTNAGLLFFIADKNREIYLVVFGGNAKRIDNDLMREFVLLFFIY